MDFMIVEEMYESIILYHYSLCNDNFIMFVT